MTIKGIDVSEHQGVINWQKVKADGIQYAILRAGYGRAISQKDKQFDNNYKGCKACGMSCGVYWYSYALTPEDAVKEAHACLEAIKGKKFEYPIYFDVEENSQFSLGKDKVSKIIQAFCDEIEKAGYWTGLYMSASPLKSYVTADVQRRYAIWVAHYGVSKPSYSGDYGMWQYSATGKVSGISGNVDLDECYIDYPALIKSAGLNGYEKQPAHTQPEEPDRLTGELKLSDGTIYDITLTKK
jgi:GH25 family lysozyme M1 (1,4-beta-N-acetylmuramidase)